MLMSIPDAAMFALNPPSISGLGQVGGFEYILEALQGQPPAEMAAVMRGLTVAANQNPALSGVFSSFEAETPQIRLDIDRDKTRTLNISLADVFAALQATLGGYYVNDFNLYGRTWTVQMLAEDKYRSSISDISAIYIKNSAGEMTPLSTIADVHLEVGPRMLTRYNNYRAISINGGPGPGRGPGEAIAAMEEVSAKTLPAGYAYEWTGQALEQIESAGQTTIVLGLALVFAYLFLVGLYESWTIPIPVLLSVSVSVLGRHWYAVDRSGSTSRSMPRSASSSSSRSRPRTPFSSWPSRSSGARPAIRCFSPRSTAPVCASVPS